MAVQIPSAYHQQRRGVRAFALKNGAVFVTTPELELGCGSFGDAILGEVFVPNPTGGEPFHRPAVMKRFGAGLEILQQAQTGQSNFKNEGDALAVLQGSTNVIKLLDYQKDTGVQVKKGDKEAPSEALDQFGKAVVQDPYLLLEYLSNGDLYRYCWRSVQFPSLEDSHSRPRPLNHRVLARIARSLLQGVCDCHRQGIVHLDIKAENVMFGDDYDAKLIDFNLAVMGSADAIRAATGRPALARPPSIPEEFGSAEWPQIGRYLGTAETAAPEVMAFMQPTRPSDGAPTRLKASPYDGRLADMWSVGATLYHLMAGDKLPWSGLPNKPQHAVPQNPWYDRHRSSQCYTAGVAVGGAGGGGRGMRAGDSSPHDERETHAQAQTRSYGTYAPNDGFQDLMRPELFPKMFLVAPTTLAQAYLNHTPVHPLVADLVLRLLHPQAELRPSAEALLRSHPLLQEATGCMASFKEAKEVLEPRRVHARVLISDAEDLNGFVASRLHKRTKMVQRAIDNHFGLLVQQLGMQPIARGYDPEEEEKKKMRLAADQARGVAGGRSPESERPTVAQASALQQRIGAHSQQIAQLRSRIAALQQGAGASRRSTRATIANVKRDLARAQELLQSNQERVVQLQEELQTWWTARNDAIAVHDAVRTDDLMRLQSESAAAAQLIAFAESHRLFAPPNQRSDFIRAAGKIGGGLATPHTDEGPITTSELSLPPSVQEGAGAMESKMRDEDDVGILADECSEAGLDNGVEIAMRDSETLAEGEGQIQARMGYSENLRASHNESSNIITFPGGAAGGQAIMHGSSNRVASEEESKKNHAAADLKRRVHLANMRQREREERGRLAQLQMQAAEGETGLGSLSGGVGRGRGRSSSNGNSTPLNFAVPEDEDTDEIRMHGTASGRPGPSSAVAGLDAAASDNDGDSEGGGGDSIVMRSAARTMLPRDEDEDEIEVVWGSLLRSEITAEPKPVPSMNHTHASRPFDADDEVLRMNALSMARGLLAAVQVDPLASATAGTGCRSATAGSISNYEALQAASTGTAPACNKAVTAAASRTSAASVEADIALQQLQQLRQQRALDDQISVMGEDDFEELVEPAVLSLLRASRKVILPCPPENAVRAATFALLAAVTAWSKCSEGDAQAGEEQTPIHDLSADKSESTSQFRDGSLASASGDTDAETAADTAAPAMGRVGQDADESQTIPLRLIGTESLDVLPTGIRAVFLGRDAHGQLRRLGLAMRARSLYSDDEAAREHRANAERASAAATGQGTAGGGDGDGAWLSAIGTEPGTGKATSSRSESPSPSVDGAVMRAISRHSAFFKGLGSSGDLGSIAADASIMGGVFSEPAVGRPSSYEINGHMWSYDSSRTVIGITPVVHSDGSGVRGSHVSTEAGEASEGASIAFGETSSGVEVVVVGGIELESVLPASAASQDEFAEMVQLLLEPAQVASRSTLVKAAF